MESFDQLAAQYHAMIYKIIHSLHIFKNVDEFFQIGLIALWEASQAYDPAKGDFTNYAYKFIKGRMLSEIERTAKLAEHYVLPKEEYWETAGAETEVPLCEYDLLLSHCEGLTKNQIKWVKYTFINDLSINQIAACEHVSPSAVKLWRQGALGKLRKL